MLHNDTRSVAFGRPGGETSCPSHGRPVDLVHLAGQTFGNRDLEQEVLGLFVQQIAEAAERISASGPDDRQRVAHALRGSAGGVGAFALADIAEALEKAPASQELTDQLIEEVAVVREFVATITR